MFDRDDALVDPLTEAEFDAAFAALIDGVEREQASRARAARLAAEERLRGAPGAGAAAAIERFTGEGALPDQPDTLLLDALRAARRLESWAQARQLAVIAELAARRSPRAGNPHEAPDSPRESPLAFRAVADEVAFELSVSRYAAEQRLDLAMTLSGRLPRTLDALEGGEIDYPKALAIAESSHGLADGAAETVESRALAVAPERTTAELRRVLAHAVIAADPAGARRRAEAAQEDRRVAFTQVSDGMCDVWMHLPAPGAMAIKAAIGALARRAKTPGDRRTADQRRADVAVEVFLRALEDPALPRTRQGRPHILVTVPASTLTGAGEEPAYLGGYGPIVAELSRDVVANGTWRCAITDDAHGTLLGLGTSTHTPGYRHHSAGARHVTVRDRTCRFVGCANPAETADLDHRVPYPRGATCECETGSLCPYHHRVKHETGFRVRGSQDPADPVGTLIWTSPTGRERKDYPAVLAPPGLPGMGQPPPGSPPGESPPVTSAGGRESDEPVGERIEEAQDPPPF